MLCKESESVAILVKSDSTDASWDTEGYISQNRSE